MNLVKTKADMQCHLHDYESIGSCVEVWQHSIVDELVQLPFTGNNCNFLKSIKQIQ